MSLMILALATAAQPAPANETAAICRNAETQRVDRARGAEMKRLDRLPPAETYLAVLHRENGCTKPILAREYRQGIGRPR